MNHSVGQIAIVALGGCLTVSIFQKTFERRSLALHPQLRAWRIIHHGNVGKEKSKGDTKQ
jgi:hypothetical protein